MRRLLLFLFLLCSVSTIAACSGGGGDSPTVPQSPSAVATLSTAVVGSIPAGTTIIAYDVSMNLPAGVTVKSSSPPETDVGVVTATGEGAGSIVIATYIAATASDPGNIRVRLASGAGMNAGEFCTITFDVAAGSSSASTDFGITMFSARGLDGSSSTVDLTTQLSVSLSGQ